MGWNLPHMFVMPQLLLGKNATEAFDKIVQQGDQLLRLLGLDLSAASFILIVLLLSICSQARSADGVRGNWERP